MAEPVTAMLGLGIGVIILIIFIGLAILSLVIFLFIFWILMIIDCATRKFKNETDKIAWILILIFLYILGAIIYYFAVKRAGRK